MRAKDNRVTSWSCRWPRSASTASWRPLKGVVMSPYPERQSQDLRRDLQAPSGVDDPGQLCLSGSSPARTDRRR